MATRRQGREWALQMLFQLDMNPGTELDQMIEKFWRQQWTCKVDEARDAGIEPKAKDERKVEDQVAPRKIREFSEAIVQGVVENLGAIDARLRGYTQNWPLHRMGSVERNVLRLAFYELIYCPDVPPPVILNEAIDLAKYFSSSDAGRFVNGILDRLNKEINGSR